MRILRCHIEAFGHFRDRIIEDLDHAVVIVQGANETGKSTFLHFLQTMLYGIYPVDATDHPYATRDGNLLEGNLTFRHTGGREATVARRLYNKSLQGHLFNGDTRDSLGNQTLPAIMHIPMKVFEAVYALAISDMTVINDKAWDEVQDRLLGGLSIDFIRPARLVVDVLESEGKSLWRPTRRGKPQAKELETQHKKLREEVRTAREHDTRLRELHDQVETHKINISRLENEKIEVKAQQRKIERLIPVRKRLKKIEEYQDEAGDISRYATLPENSIGVLEELGEQIKKITVQLEDIAQAIEDAEKRCEDFTEQDDKLIEQASSIRAWMKKASAHETLITQLDKARSDMSRTRAYVEGHTKRILTVSWNDALIRGLRDLSMAALRQRVRAYKEAADRLQIAQTQAQTLALKEGEPQSWIPWVIVVVVGVGLFIVGVVISLSILQLLGVGLLCLGGVQTHNAYEHNKKLDRQVERLELKGLEQEKERCGRVAAELLHDIPIPKDRANAPDRDLLDDLQGFKDALDDYSAYVKEIKKYAVEIKVNKRSVQELVEVCELPLISSVADMVSNLEAKLNEAEERQRLAKDAREKLGRLTLDQGSYEDERNRLIAQTKEIKNALSELGEGDLDTGDQVLRQRREAASLTAHYQESLQQEHPDWEDLRDEIETLEAGEGAWTFSDEEVVRVEQRLEEIQETLREEDIERAEKAEAMEHLQKEHTVDVVESKIAHVEEQLRDVKRERDRLVLLANLIRRADHQFRMKHQPDVIQLASAHLNTITAGRYVRLDLEEGGNQLLVYENGEDFPYSVGQPLSQGTLNQIYLAIRIAIIDHLDENQERLPVFLDEIFVNWDPCRREQGYRILRKMTEQRQLFIFTCHPGLAGELEEQLAAYRLVL